MFYGEGFRSAMLSFDEEVLLRKFRTLVGSDSEVLDFSRPIDMQHPRSHAMMRSIRFALQEMEAGGTDTPALILDELSELVMLSFLLATERQLQDETGTRSESDSHLGRVTEYLDVHWNEPLDIEKLAAIAGTSGRTVFRAFKRQHGETPAQFLRRTRLSRAKQMLQTAGPEGSVAAIALACGFASPGHFAQHYRSLFGEKPSETMRRVSFGRCRH